MQDKLSEYMSEKQIFLHRDILPTILQNFDYFSASDRARVLEILKHLPEYEEWSEETRDKFILEVCREWVKYSKSQYISDTVENNGNTFRYSLSIIYPKTIPIPDKAEMIYSIDRLVTNLGFNTLRLLPDALPEKVYIWNLNGLAGEIETGFIKGEIFSNDPGIITIKYYIYTDMGRTVLSDIEEITNRNGFIHSVNDKPGYIKYKNGYKTEENWYTMGQLDRITGPAYILYWEDSDKPKQERWYTRGKLTSINNNPAVTSYFREGGKNTELWLKNQREYNENGPSYIEYYPDGITPKVKHYTHTYDDGVLTHHDGILTYHDRVLTHHDNPVTYRYDTLGNLISIQ